MIGEACGDRQSWCVCTLPAGHESAVHACTSDGCQGSWTYGRDGSFFPVTDCMTGQTFEEWFGEGAE